MSKIAQQKNPTKNNYDRKLLTKTRPSCAEVVFFRVYCEVINFVKPFDGQSAQGKISHSDLLS